MESECKEPVLTRIDPAVEDKQCKHHPDRKAVAWDYTFRIAVCQECKDKYDKMDDASFDF